MRENAVNVMKESILIGTVYTWLQEHTGIEVH